jgi:hypothetical protein
VNKGSLDVGYQQAYCERYDAGYEKGFEERTLVLFVVVMPLYSMVDSELSCRSIDPSMQFRKIIAGPFLAYCAMSSKGWHKSEWLQDS